MHDRTNPSPVQAMTATLERPPVPVRRRPSTPITPTMTSPAPWAGDIDPDRAIAEIGEQFPVATVWFGEYTGSYWALTHAQDGTPGLVEGATPEALSRRLDFRMPRLPQRRRPQMPSHRALHRSATSYLPPAAQALSSRRPSRKRGRCRGRHSMPRTLGRSGRC